MIDLAAIPTSDLAALVAKASQELARRAEAGASPVQLALLDDLAPVDPSEINLDERLPGGERRFITPKQAAALCRLDPGTLIRRIQRGDPVGVRIGGRYFIDVTKIRGRG
ncbi:hypothetical protein ASE36_18995 [Rhizobium sp. Root274]|uniref:hypothetical protein n=1 Tax=unclassified Rhizobium TaxID=2613769 RepID=UPI000713D04E|nr:MULTISPECIES: hypothetical protein [unclassified Rhizobium]KQW27031.1 hypothetical protein ASC71_20080 [Rhizobium sp. Root1240]KRD27907.1 hypothetical protein ASE36_18995 [Rhizobium sp. Root274]